MYRLNLVGMGLDERGGERIEWIAHKQARIRQRAYVNWSQMNCRMEDCMHWTMIGRKKEHKFVNWAVSHCKGYRSGYGKCSQDC